MARYFNEQTLLDMRDKDMNYVYDLTDLEEYLAGVPTADVVEVVRCKDCAHYIEMKGYDYNGKKARSCVWHSQLRRETDFCSDAIKKGGAR